MTPPYLAALLVKVLLVILDEETSNMAMTPPIRAAALLLVKVLLMILNEDPLDMNMTPPS